MSKKFYWLKLKDDFFNQKEIKKLRKIAGGDTYTIIYQKLLLISLKNEGKIYFDGVEDDFVDEMALELDEMVDNVKMTYLYLQKHDLIEQRSDNEFYMTRLDESIGSESESAERVRRMRARKSILGIKNVDEARYGGNGQKVLERDNYCCAVCSSNKNICIHHKNGSSNEMVDLITLCRKCHSKQHVTSNALTVTSNGDVTKCNTEIEIDIDIEKDINNKDTCAHTREDRDTKPKKKVKRFVKPSLEDVERYFKEIGSNVDASKWYDHYESNGWKVAKNPMKDWKACCRNWNRNEFRVIKGTAKVEQRDNFKQRDYEGEDLSKFYSNVGK